MSAPYGDPEPEASFIETVPQEVNGPAATSDEPIDHAALDGPALHSGDFDPAVTWGSSREGNNSSVDLHFDPIVLNRYGGPGNFSVMNA